MSLLNSYSYSVPLVSLMFSDLMCNFKSKFKIKPTEEGKTSTETYMKHMKLNYGYSHDYML